MLEDEIKSLAQQKRSSDKVGDMNKIAFPIEKKSSDKVGDKAENIFLFIP